MRKTTMIMVGMALSVILVSLALSPADVLGFKIHGPTPIPGYLFPHPGKHMGSPQKNMIGPVPNPLA